MSFADLGKRLARAARRNGKALFQDLEGDLKRISPNWSKAKVDLRYHGQKLRQDFESVLRQWVEEEMQRRGVTWESLFGNTEELEESYQLLGLPYGTEMEQVKRRWHDLLKENHPNRFMTNPQEYERATKTTQYLTAAYHCILRAKEQGHI